MYQQSPDLVPRRLLTFYRIITGIQNICGWAQKETPASSWQVFTLLSGTES